MKEVILPMHVSERKIYSKFSGDREKMAQVEGNKPESGK